MDLMLVLLGAGTFPVACLGFVLWMGRLEDTIATGVRRTTRRPDPAPILAVPVRRTDGTHQAGRAVEASAPDTGRIPSQRLAPVPSTDAAPAGPAPVAPAPVAPAPLAAVVPPPAGAVAPPVTGT